MGRVYKTGYVIVQVNPETGDMVDTLDATFNQATAEEMVMTFAYEWLWRRWYYALHGNKSFDWGYVSSVYKGKLSDAPIEIRKIKWYE